MWALPLHTLLTRSVPVRGLEPGPLGGVARLRWADGTAMLVVAGRPGDLGRVLRALDTRRSVTLARYDPTDDGVELVLRGVPGKEPVRLVVTGRDQPD